MRKTFSTIALAIGFLVAASAANANLVSNGTFNSPDIASGSFSTIPSVSFADLNWGFYGGATGQTKLVDDSSNQFAQIASGDVLYTSFSVVTSGLYTIGFDYQGGGLWGLTGSSWTPEVVAPTYVTPAAGWTSTSSSVSLVGGDSYKLYFGGMVTPPQFYPTLNLDNVSVTAVTPVPEPESYAMMLAGLGALGLMSRRRMRKGA